MKIITFHYTRLIILNRPTRLMTGERVGIWIVYVEVEQMDDGPQRGVA